jgi:chromosome segregation ATPase
MAMPARKLEWETPVEDRLGKIEAHIEHMRSDISDLKVDVRRLNEKVDEVDKRLGGKIDDVDKRLCDKIDEVDKRLGEKIDDVDKRICEKIDSLDQKLCGKIEAACGKTDEVDKRLGGKIDEVDKRLGEKIDEVDKRLTGKLDGLKDSMEKEFRTLDRERLYDRVWFLLIAAAILGVMAHGFKWF